ncbi:hypothetical protein CAEBREN_15348 [Caenorhabditis brenneri]|uniref:Uncharacterized protein n=1 Tax=Caenorhabditis brenneri TaxID=135651 RepID=G0N2Z7_CAEBE|nr:hypothetical protein CAEBREN_15348 [Caenorhabditis brenneri]
MDLESPIFSEIVSCELSNQKEIMYQTPNTILIVLLLTLVVQSLNAAGYVEIELGGPNDPCNKYTKKGTDYLALTHLYNNIVCNLESHDDIYKYKFKCDGKKSGRTDTVYYLIVGVRATKQMLSGSIEYMYREDTMHLFENGFLDPANMKNEKFNHDRHLHIKVVKIDGLIHFDDDRKMTDCHKYFPHRLIADHGLYMMVQVDGKENLMQPMYYEPYEHEGRMEIGRANCHSQFFRSFEKLKSKEAHRKTEANFWKMLPNTILIVLLLTLVVQSLNAVGTVEIELGGPNDPCAKYTEKGTDYLALTHVRVIENIENPEKENFQIVQNIGCKLKSYDGKYKYLFECDGKRSGRTDTLELLMFGVKVIKQTLSSSVEYMYREDTMEMFGKGFLDPVNMKNEKFHHNRHLYIKSITTDGVVFDGSHSQFFRNFEKLKSKEAYRKTEANCWKMLPNTILIVLLLTFMVQSLNATGYVEVELGGPNDPCYKYTEEGHNYLEITHVRVLEAIENRPKDNIQIVKNIMCNLKSHNDPYKYKFECEGKRSGRTDTKELLMFGVKVIKQTLSGSIEYMYREDTMHLFENGFLDPANMKNEKFHHNRHLHIKSITTNGVVYDKRGSYAAYCHEAFPHSLISDHGLYVFVQLSAGKNGVIPMYYEPLEHEGIIHSTFTNH